MEIINQVENDIFLILFGRDDVALENAEEIDLPEFDIHSLNGQLAEIEEKIKVYEKNKDQLARIAIPVLGKKSKELATTIEFYKVLDIHTLSEGEGKIKILENT